MNYITLTCPDCDYACVYNCRGRCRCGSYLIAAFEGINKGRRLTLPDGRVWGYSNNKWVLLKDAPYEPFWSAKA